MKILYVITQGQMGGAQKYVLSLAKRFGGMVATGAEETDLLGECMRQGLTTFTLNKLKRSINPFQDFMAAWEIRRLVLELKPDIVHLNSSKAGILGSFACFGLKTKVVFTAHGFIFNEDLPFWKKTLYIALEKTASSCRDFIIAVSEADKQSALANQLIAPTKIRVIHNGIGQINFLDAAAARQKLQLNSDKIIIGSVANAYQNKGLDILISAVRELPLEIKNKFLLVNIGDGPETENLKSLIKTQGLTETIKLLGPIKNASAYMRAFDIFILPSRKEGFPYVLLEAMQAGLPVIATQIGGNPEALGDAGMLVKPNPEALAGAIKKLCVDQLLLKQLGEQAKARATQFSEDKMLSETEKVYKEI